MKTFISIIIPFLFISFFAQGSVINPNPDTSKYIPQQHCACCPNNTFQDKEKIIAPESNIDRVISILKLVGTLMGVLVGLIALLITIAGTLGFFRWNKIIKDAKQSLKKVKVAERIVKPIMERIKKAEEDVAKMREKMPKQSLEEEPSDELKKKMAEYGEKIKLLETFGMPLKAEDYFNKGNDLYYTSDYKSALIAYEKVIELKPDSHLAWYNKGITLNKLKRSPEEVLKAFEKSIELKPDYALAWYNKGITLGKLKRSPEEVLKAFEKSIEFKPDFVEAWNNKGITLGKLNRHEEALKAFEKVIELKPDHASAWFNKACAYALKGDKKNALINLSQAVKLDVAFKGKAKIDEDFRTLWNDEDFKKLTD